MILYMLNINLCQDVRRTLFMSVRLDHRNGQIHCKHLWFIDAHFISEWVVICRNDFVTLRTKQVTIFLLVFSFQMVLVISGQRNLDGIYVPDKAAPQVQYRDGSTYENLKRNVPTKRSHWTVINFYFFPIKEKKVLRVFNFDLFDNN